MTESSRLARQIAAAAVRPDRDNRRLTQQALADLAGLWQRWGTRARRVVRFTDRREWG